ncbi:MAG: hypothetical protein COT71_01935 [Candidatus Andersenbacteria bacterium CG10_big_fil_rev_8_21_14_0_10_54_11]|uniref:Nitroreductase domain-containing protein n=1 Tax=Candidatus Andersenbacteria bacterium CG10_big_fil_rev_8_21_14_0_10_54_11 TaxID=1974485 RepID=A0A2M6WZJ7_9BACT|nr:MAG: hypothetical protein COT71_01935 [Candidatus Andersenbacteria bacterium CG10_big_fil_rev_8_21_14_0_10_54_11]
MAPSAHNTQPWKFRVNGDKLDIFVDWDRHLHISDPDHRQLYVSLGCAVTNAAIAARHWDMAARITYFPQGEGEDQPVARVILRDGYTDPNTKTVANELFAAIAERRTDRSLYDAHPLTAAEKAQLPAAQHPQVIFIEDRDIINHIARLSELGTEHTLSRKDFKQELSHWVRNNWTRQPDGMPGYAMGMPAPVSLLSRLMVRMAPIHKQEAPKTRLQIESASALAVITSTGDTPAQWLEAGRVLEQLWLEAAVAGLAVMPQVAAIEAGEDVRRQLQRAINSDQLPQSIIRIGRSSAGALRSTPRRTLEDCIK